MDHLGIDRTPARQAIVTGDPERVPVIARHLGGGREVAARRGLLCWEASPAHGPVLVVASGIGAPSSAIVVEELAELGCHTVVRLGTCGAIQPYVRPGDLVVSTGCVRDEGTSRQYIGLSFPAVPDPALTTAVLGALEGRDDVPLHAGITHCKDAYYLERPDRQLRPRAVAEYWGELRRAGVLVTEMESSALFVLGSLRGLRTAALFVNVGRSTPEAAFERALGAAVGAARTAFETVGPPARRPLPATADGGAVPRSYLDRDAYEESP